jgi:hypothetical protein
MAGHALAKPSIGDPAQQLGVGGHQLVELELAALLALVEGEGPAAVLVALRAARVLDDTVE